jgi:hypothetical protein
MLRLLLSFLALISGLAVEARAADLPARAPVAAVQVVVAQRQAAAFVAPLSGRETRLAEAPRQSAPLAAYSAPALRAIALKVDRARE